MLTTINSSRNKIRHPGLACVDRRRFVRGEVSIQKLRLSAGSTLINAIQAALRDCKDGAAFLRIDGLKLLTGKFVLPAEAKDDQHVAWYSDSHEMTAPVFRHGTVVLGRKEGAWFAHCHAAWINADGVEEMGHLLCAEALIAEDFDAEFHIFSGGSFEVALDPETNFSLMTTIDAHKASSRPNAILLTIKPHEDLRLTIDEICSELGIHSASILGVGSLIGADFADGPPMTSELSEIVLLRGARVSNGQCVELPICCVTPDRSIFRGDLLAGRGAVLITCELLIFTNNSKPND